MSALVCLGRRTLTGLLSTCGRQFGDWSADYKLISKGRFEAGELFATVRRGVASELPADAPFVVAMDDSLLRKTGAKIHGVGWRRDPLGPPFHTNFIRAQRVLQLSAALVPEGGDGVATRCPARMIPIDFRHCPTANKPPKGASEEQWERWRAQSKACNISRRGVDRLQALRRGLDEDPGPRRDLWVVVDGRFTNATVLKSLPPRSVLIGRIRKDAKLHPHPRAEAQPASQRVARGRKRLYGTETITPEALRQDPRVRWRGVKAYAAGRRHAFRVKTLAPLLWRPAGADRALRLVVIAPLAYRPRKGSRLLYRKPAYLICTDPTLSVEKVLQAYLWRWEIEVNFRDEKTLLGVGQAQVRHERSVESVPALIVAAYAMLLLAGCTSFGAAGCPDALPPPKWRRSQPKRRASTQDLIHLLRAELWGKAIGLENFSGFPTPRGRDEKPEKWKPDLPSALLYAAA